MLIHSNVVFFEDMVNTSPTSTLYCWISRLFIFVVLLCSPGIVSAKIIEPRSLLDQVIQAYYGIYQFTLETNVIVYDPEVFAPLDEEIGEGFNPYELKDNGFTQKIIWVRDEYLMIETFDLNWNPLHFYIEDFPGRSFSQNTQTLREFSDSDISFPHLIFYTKHVPILDQRLTDLGIVTTNVKIVEYNNDSVYQLGTDQNNILVDPNTFQVIEVNQRIQVAGRYYPLKITFSDWDPSQKELPRLTTYYINSRLVKMIQLIDHKRGMGAERNEFVERYKASFPALHPFSVDVYYGK